MARVCEQELLSLLELASWFVRHGLVIAVCAAKTFCVGFDNNENSIPPKIVGRRLALAASEPAERFSAEETVYSYKRLAEVELAFRSVKFNRFAKFLSAPW